MKTKIATLCMAVMFSILTLATHSSAADPGFYDKDHIRGFISFGADVRGMTSGFKEYVNNTAFVTSALKGSGSDTAFYYPAAALKYKKFDSSIYPGLHFNVGAQYKQFMTWINFNFMITQTSERPGKAMAAADTSGNMAAFPLYDARWFTYGADWMFGWKLLGEEAFFNLIPAVGIGFNMMNIHFTSNWVVFSEDKKGEYSILRDRYYSTIAASFNAELEARLQFDPISVGLYAGYRVVRYNEIEGEGSIIKIDANGTDNDGDTWFVGLRLTWTFLSPWDKKQQDKI